MCVICLFFALYGIARNSKVSLGILRNGAPFVNTFLPEWDICLYKGPSLALVWPVGHPNQGVDLRGAGPELVWLLSGT